MPGPVGRGPRAQRGAPGVPLLSVGERKRLAPLPPKRWAVDLLRREALGTALGGGAAAAAAPAAAAEALTDRRAAGQPASAAGHAAAAGAVGA